MINEESWWGREDLAVEVGDGLHVAGGDVAGGVAIWVQPPEAMSEPFGVLWVDEGVRDAAAWRADGEAKRLGRCGIGGIWSNSSNSS